MANEKGQSKVTLLGKLTFAPEAREQDKPRPIIEGRFKYFWAVFKGNNNHLMAANLLMLLFCIPLLIVLVLPSVFGGMENISHLLAKTSAIPYFMSDVGIGISEGEAIIVGTLGIMKVYQLYFLAISCCLPFMSFGLAGIFHIGAKLIWQDGFITKKDDYGNNVPRIPKEFFIGVKKYWAQFLIVMTVVAILFAGISSAFINFIQQNMQNQVGAIEWVLVIVASIVGVVSIMLIIFLLPTIVMYELPLLTKLKNSFILVVSMFIPSFFLALASTVPFILISTTSGFFKVIIVAVLLVFGGGFYALLWTNFVQYHADKIITPVYEAQNNKNKKKKKKN